MREALVLLLCLIPCVAHGITVHYTEPVFDDFAGCEITVYDVAADGSFIQPGIGTAYTTASSPAGLAARDVPFPAISGPAEGESLTLGLGGWCDDTTGARSRVVTASHSKRGPPGPPTSLTWD